MGTVKTTWSENNAITGFNAASLVAGLNTSGDIDLDASGYDVVSIQIKVVFGSTPDGDVVVDILASPDSGTSDDTIALSTVSIAFATSATKRITIRASDLAFIQVKATNNDSADTVDVSALYAGRTWVTT